MKFVEGEEVLAKPPNTVVYKKGRIIGARGEKYKIEFDNGTEYNVHKSDIKAERSSRSGSRKSVRGGRKSPSRNSPGRRSPSRRSPARSPTSRTRKLPVRNIHLPKLSLERITNEGNDKVEKKKASSEDSPTDLMPLQSRLKESQGMPRRSSRLSSSRRTLITNLRSEEEHSFMIGRSIDRAVSLPAESKARQIYRFPFEEKGRGHSVLRDQDLLRSLDDRKNDSQDEEEIVEKRKKDINLVSQPQEWAGWCGTGLLIFALPLSVIAPQLACSKDHCGARYFQVPTDLTLVQCSESFLAYMGFLVFVTIVSALPVGKRVQGQQSKNGRLQYRMNGFFCAVASIIIFAICTYSGGMGMSDFILENSLRFSLCGWMMGTILALLLYIRASGICVADLNIFASTDSKIYNFWQGREINPRVNSLDIKITLIRASVISTLIINLAVVVKAFEEVESFRVERINVPVVLVTTLQIFRALDVLILESTVLTTFEILYEGTGYMITVGHLLYPFLATLTSRFFLYNKMKCTYLVGLPILTFVLGYTLYRKSNSEKDEFRRNPLSPILAHLETIPTSRGKKLMVSGLWGYVRHPNYFGDILMHWSLAWISLPSDIIPYYAALCCTLLLMYRAIRDDARCKARYGRAWEQYSSRVNSMIFKRVF